MRGADPVTLLEAARSVLRSLDPELPIIQPGTLAELVDRQLAQPRFYLLLLAIFAALAVVLAAVGMYGVVAYAVSQRTREIGVRMALGARVPQVVRLVLWQGIRPAVWGIGLGIVGALAAGGLMRGLLYGVAPKDPITLAVVPPLLLGIVVLACAIPARRAVRIPPATALRNE
jgi:putative ABC transport system permease protein